MFHQHRQHQPNFFFLEEISETYAGNNMRPVTQATIISGSGYIPSAQQSNSDFSNNRSLNNALASLLALTDGLNNQQRDENKFELISFNTCPYVQRAVITGLMKGVPFKYTNIDLKNKPAWFSALSPLGKVPVLRMPGHDRVLFESNVITQFLDGNFDTRPLLPEDVFERSVSLAWMDYIDQMMGEYFNMMRASDESTFGSKRNVVLSMLKTMEADAQITLPYFDGYAFGLVDATAAPFFQRMAFHKELFAELLDETPRIRQWAMALANSEVVWHASAMMLEMEGASIDETKCAMIESSKEWFKDTWFCKDQEKQREAHRESLRKNRADLGHVTNKKATKQPVKPPKPTARKAAEAPKKAAETTKPTKAPKPSKYALKEEAKPAAQHLTKDTPINKEAAKHASRDDKPIVNAAAPSPRFTPKRVTKDTPIDKEAAAHNNVEERPLINCAAAADDLLDFIGGEAKEETEAPKEEEHMSNRQKKRLRKQAEKEKEGDKKESKEAEGEKKTSYADMLKDSLPTKAPKPVGKKNKKELQA